MSRLHFQIYTICVDNLDSNCIVSDFPLVFVVDQDSLNGTFVNNTPTCDQRGQGQGARLVGDGDVIRIGRDIRFTLSMAVELDNLDDHEIDRTLKRELHEMNVSGFRTYYLVLPPYLNLFKSALTSLLILKDNADMNICIRRRLGKGTFARVFLAEDTRERKQLACKIIERKCMDSNTWRKKVVNEIQYHRELHHVGVIVLVAFSRRSPQPGTN